MMNQNQLSGILGAALLFSGLFAPLFSSPVIGQVDYFHYNATEATIVLGLASLSLTLALVNRFAMLALTGIGLFALLALAFIKYELYVTGTAIRWMGKFADSPYEGINRLNQDSLALGWGWGLLVAGATLVLAAGRLKGYGR